MAAATSSTSVSFNDEGFLGSLNLNRKKEEGDFSDREVQILELIEPHLTNRLSKWRVRADRSSSEIVFAHDYDVSAREIDVCRCVLSGMDNAAIAEELSISTGTVKKHLENIFRKTQVNSRVGLMRSFSSTRRSSSKTVLAREPAHAL